MSLNITPSPFGSLSVSVAETNSTLQVGVLATSPCELNVNLGVPGPKGDTGAQGPAGTNGTNGVGVPVGGTTGQVLAKINSTNYNTEWVDAGAAGDFLPLSGGTMSGTIFLPSLRNLLNADLTVTAYNDTGAGTNFIHSFGAFDGTFALATNGGGLKFPDETVQTTAGLPLTGGTLTGSLVLSDDVYSSGVSKTISGNAVSGDSYVGYEIGSDTASGSQGSALKIKFGNTDEGYENQAILQQNGLTFKEAIGDIIFARYDTNGILFQDSTTQTTAGLPLTGGIVTNAGYTYELLDEGFVVTQGTTIVNVGNAGISLQGAGIVVENFAGITTTIGDGVELTDGVNNLYILPTGITFPDASTQTTAGLPLTGGTLSAGLIISTGGITIEDPDANGNSIDIYSGGAIRFGADDSYQTTAGLPLTGGTMSGQIAFEGVGTALDIRDGGAIRFGADDSYQTTAFPPTGGLVTEYITGTGTLVTFPTIPSFATTAQAQAGTSTTTVINPATLREMLMTANVTKLSTGLLSGTSGTGGTNDSGGYDFIRLACPNSASGVYVSRYRNIYAQKSGSLSANMSFANSVALQFRLSLTTTTGTDPNSTGYIGIGENTFAVATLPSVRSIGVQLNFGSNIKIVAHNGTTLTTYTTSTSVASLYINACDFLLTNDYATGTVTLYLNGTSIGSTTGGVTTHASSFNGRQQFGARAFNASVPSGTQLGFIVYSGTAIVL